MSAELSPRPGLPPMVGWRASSSWGAVAGVVPAATVLLFLGYAYFYLYITQPERWPPAGHAAPGLLWPAAGAAVLVASAGPLPYVWRATHTGGGHRVSAAVVTVAALGAGGVALVGVELAGLGLDVDAHAYDAIVLTLHAYQGLVTAAGVVMALVTAYYTNVPGQQAWARRAAPVVVVWWSFAVLGWLGTLATVYLWPQVS